MQGQGCQVSMSISTSQCLPCSDYEDGNGGKTKIGATKSKKSNVMERERKGGGLKTIERFVSVGGGSLVPRLLPCRKAGMRLLGGNKPIIQQKKIFSHSCISCAL